MSRSHALTLVLAAAFAAASAAPANAGTYGGGSGSNGGGGNGGGNGGGSDAMPAPAQNNQPLRQATGGGGGSAMGSSGGGQMGGSSGGEGFNDSHSMGSAPDPRNSAGMGNSGPGKEDSTNEPEAKPAPMSSEDAADNFKTVVESYVAKKSAGGAWEYKEKGKTSPLVLTSVDGGPLKTGKEVYTGEAIFRDAATKRKRRLEFTVDFSGAKWKVVRVRPSQTH